MAAAGVTAVGGRRVGVASRARIVDRASVAVVEPVVAAGLVQSAVCEIVLGAVAGPEADVDREFELSQRVSEGVQRAVRVAELAADNVGRLVIVPHPVACSSGARGTLQCLCIFVACRSYLPQVCMRRRLCCRSRSRSLTLLACRQCHCRHELSSGRLGWK